MAVRIRSLATSGPVVVPLTSGGTVRLSPGEASEELAEVEVTDNAKLEKLRGRRMVEVEPVTDGQPAEQIAAAGDEADGEADTEEAPDGGSTRAEGRSSRSRKQ
jgi:hypothetical protein